MKKLLALLLTFTLLFGTLTPIEAVEKTVTVQLPQFSVSLNGQAIDNNYSKYPLIVYQDITYFPMTYYDCRFLGVETAWKNAENGLFIQSTGIQGVYAPYTQKNKNPRSSSAKIASFPITVNDQVIDNAAEPYPLLVFRDVTYFPMTWRFCVNEFHWQYRFSAKDGLVISSPGKSIEQYGMLPQQTTDPEQKNIVAADGKYIYYLSGNPATHVMCAPINQLSQAKAIYELPENYILDNGMRVSPSLYEENGSVYMTYHIGGATMGSTKLFRLDANSAAPLEADNYELFSYPTASFRYFAGPWPGSDNLFMKKATGDWERIGPEGYMFGWNWKMDEKSEGGASTRCFYYDGSRYLYTLGFDIASAYEKVKQQDFSEKTGIYRIDIQTNEAERISDLAYAVNGFTVDTIAKNPKLYYFHDQTLYQYTLSSQVLTPLEDTALSAWLQTGAHCVDQCIAINDTLYLVASKPGAGGASQTELYVFSPKDHRIEPFHDLSYIKQIGIKKDCLVITCYENARTDYRTVVVSKNGDVLFQSADATDLSSTYIQSDDTFYFYNHTTNRFCSCKLHD